MIYPSFPRDASSPVSRTRGRRWSPPSPAWGLGVFVALLLGCGRQAAMHASQVTSPVATRAADRDAQFCLSESPHGAEQAGGDEASEPAPERKLIRDAELHLTVDSCDDAQRAIEADVARRGGFLASANVTHREGRVSHAYLVLRLPCTSLEEALETYSALGDVTQESLKTQDITEDYFDLDARLTNARKLEARLQDLLDTRTSTLKDVIDVERELGNVRETIERFEGKLRLWDRQVALSTLTVELATRARFAGGPPTTLGARMLETLGGSWTALVTAGRGLVLALVAVLPWILPVFFLGWLLFRFARRASRRA